MPKPAASRWTRRFLVLLLAATLAAPGFAAAPGPELKVIELRHRPVEEVMPLVQPLLAPGDALTGRDFKLIVRTSEKRLREIEKLLATIDIASRQWTLTVRQTVVGDRDRARGAIAAERSSGNAQIIISGRRGNSNSTASIETGAPGNRTRIEAEHQASMTGSEQRQTLRVQDGKKAFVRIGETTAHLRQTTAGPDIALTGTVTGFDVLPHAQGGQIRLDITPRLAGGDTSGRSLASYQALTTSVTVRPGEWLDLGQLDRIGEDLRRAIAQGDTAREGGQRTVLIRLE